MGLATHRVPTKGFDLRQPPLPNLPGAPDRETAHDDGGPTGDELAAHLLSGGVEPTRVSNISVNRRLEGLVGSHAVISKKVYESDGMLRLASIDHKILEIFKITRLDKVFEIHADRKSAIESMEQYPLG